MSKIVVVIDCGSKSEGNVKKLRKKRYHVIGTLTMAQAKKYFEIPIDRFEFIYKNRKGHEIIGYRTFTRLYDDEYTIVITFNKSTAKNNSIPIWDTNINFLKRDRHWLKN